MRNGSSVLIVILHFIATMSVNSNLDVGNYVIVEILKNSVWCVCYIFAFKGCYKTKLKALLHLHSHVSWQWLWLAAAHNSLSHRQDLFRRGATATFVSHVPSSLAVGSFCHHCIILNELCSPLNALQASGTCRERRNCAASALGICSREMNCGRYLLIY